MPRKRTRPTPCRGAMPTAALPSVKRCGRTADPIPDSTDRTSSTSTAHPTHPPDNDNRLARCSRLEHAAAQGNQPTTHAAPPQVWPLSPRSDRRGLADDAQGTGRPPSISPMPSSTTGTCRCGARLPQVGGRGGVSRKDAGTFDRRSRRAPRFRGLAPSRGPTRCHYLFGLCRKPSSLAMVWARLSLPRSAMWWLGHMAVRLRIRMDSMSAPLGPTKPQVELVVVLPS